MRLVNISLHITKMLEKSRKVIQFASNLGKKRVIIPTLIILPFILPYLGFDLLSIPFIDMCLYGLYSAINSTDNYFRKRGYKNAVLEFEFIKKILFIAMPILFVSMISVLLLIFIRSPFGVYIFIINIISSLIVIAAGIRIVSLHARKEYRFYFAKGYCKIMSEKEDEFERSKYLFLVLDSYNKYLRRISKFEISGIEKIYSKFNSSNIEERNNIIKSMCESLEGDRLQLIRYISTLGIIPETEVLARESIQNKLKVIGTILAAAIPIIISIISLLIQYPHLINFR